MKDLTAILAAAERIAQANEEAVLVTLVKTLGSSYRKPGARMLILPGCRTIGTISGGCLEPAVARQAWDQTRNGKPTVMIIDSSPEDDDWPPPSPSTGCRGKLFLLAEPFRTRHPTLDFIAQSHQVHQPALVLHHFRLVNDSLIPTVTEKRGQGSFPATRSQWLDHPQTPAFLEFIPPPPHLLICGAGDDARSVANIAHELAWQVTILDSRSRLATQERFPTAATISAAGPPTLPALLKQNTAIVLMSHRFADDRDYLAQIFTQTQGAPHGNAGLYPPLYLGILGTRPRTDRLLAQLAAHNIRPSASQLARLFAPIGLPLGPAHSPESIALSIIAQIHSVLTAADAPVGPPTT